MINLRTIKPLMKSIFSERNIVVMLFVMVLITFSLAQEDSKKMEQMYTGAGVTTVSHQLAQRINTPPSDESILIKTNSSANPK